MYIGRCKESWKIYIIFMKKIIDFDDLIVKSYDRIRLEGKSYGSFVKEYIVKFLNDVFRI